MPSSKPTASSHEHSSNSIVVLHKYCSICIAPLCIAPLCIAQLCIAPLHIAQLCIVSNQLLHFIWMAPIPFHCSISIGPNVWLQANCCIAYAEHLCYGSINTIGKHAILLYNYSPAANIRCYLIWFSPYKQNMQVQLSCKYAAQYNLIQIHFAVFQWIVENHCAMFQYNLTPSCVIQKIWCLRYIGFYIQVCWLHFNSMQECGAQIQLKPDAWLLTSIFILSKEACPIQWLNTNCSP